MRSGCTRMPSTTPSHQVLHVVEQVVESGRITRSTEECEMSRSCQSATFSSAGLRVAAQQPREPGDPLAGDRVALVRHRARPLLALPERLLDLAHLGALEVADLEREPLERRARERDRVQQLGVAVARHDLGRERLGPQAEPLQHLALDVRARAPSTSRPRPRACRPRPARTRCAAGCALRSALEREAGELQAERRRLGVHAVRAPDAERVRETRARARRARRSARRRRPTSSRPASRSWSARPVSSTSEDVRP